MAEFNGGEPYMSNKSYLSIIVLVLFVFILCAACSSTNTQNQPKGGLKINGWSSALGGVNGTDLDQTKFSYSINLTNENEKNIFIVSIQPSVNETIKNRILSKEIVVAVNKEMKPNETIQINGEIIVDTAGLGKPDIAKLEPFITDIKVSTEETVNLK
jgi:hypothetical protein